MGEQAEQACCVHRLIEEQVGRTPDAVAVVYQDACLTYREVERRAACLAARLQDLGIGPETLVGLYMERCLEMVISLLAVLKAGGAFVPLDPTYPQERLHYVLTDAGVSVVLTRRALRAALPASTEALALDDPAFASVDAGAPMPRRVAVCPHNLCYVIYTSGSTGRPKGVQVLHAAVVTCLAAVCRRTGIGGQDTLVSITTFAFDIAYLEIFAPLMRGARLVLADQAAARGFRLARALAESGATVLQATPSIWQILSRTGWRASQRLTLLCGGEALTPQLARLLRAGGAQLWNLYGPTEATIWASAAAVTGDTISLGQPLEHMQLYLLDSASTPACEGEIYIGGPGLARGYLGRPDLTAERFIPHPFSCEPGQRLYRTGDLARVLDDGSFAYLGRLDNQVKLHGFRIEPGEIEAILRQHPAVDACLVMAREDEPGEKRLVAYIVGTRTQAPPESDALRSHVQQQLPPYMTPAAFVILQAWPLLPNGKVDRASLPPPAPPT